MMSETWGVVSGVRSEVWSVRTLVTGVRSEV